MKSFLVALARGCWGLLLIAAAAAPALAQPLRLEAAQGVLDAWPAVTVLPDADGSLDVAQVRARASAFEPPDTPHANLGRRSDTVWLRLPLVLPADAPAQWVLAVEYPSIDRIDLYLPGAREPVSLGRAVPFSRHPLPSAWHATPVTLEPGRATELLLRVQTRSTMVLPLTLSTPEAFLARESRNQLLQGLLAGASLCLLLYSLAQWVSLRDATFLAYSLSLGGTAIFFIAYFGLGPQHLWGDQPWLALHAAPLSVLLALFGGCVFIERVLGVRQVWRRVSDALRAVAGISLLAALAFGAGLIDYRVAQSMASVLGPLPMLLAIPVAWRRMRAGDSVGTTMLVGWVAYAVATLTMAGLLRGLVPSNFWTQHSFQFGAMVEMVLWMRVLALRIEDLRRAAQRATVERDALRSLAHTDALTGLPNRRGLNEVLQRLLPAATPERMAAVFLLDLDGFKPVNDRLGHDAGDELLVGVARRLESLLRSSDTVARLGGDEFVVVAGALPGDAEAQALGRKLLEAFRQPFDVAGQEVRVGLTIGYALAPLDGRDALGLLKRADAAMYAGKQAGRDCLRRGQASVGLAGV
ncbi:diguanylate cyclase [Piscinibacter defluvii]|uniref:diguanylate cyclase n=1 Tax=Piscinibacter defluvii TaxID=1796922 RepID=UPI0013E2ED01|nr:diguanylate cyclase [Piscinibacter defluvii]